MICSRKIALLVPSRERIANKANLVNSIISTVSNLDNVVLYFGIDDDDPTKNDVRKMFKNYPWIKMVEIHNDGRFLGLGRLWNLCAMESKDEILGMIGDDMVFSTKNWDVEILKEFDGTDNFKMVYCHDGRHGKKIAVNSFIHRKYIELTGHYAKEEFMADFIDLWLQQIFRSFDRLIFREDILIEHRHWAFGKAAKDDVAKNLGSFSTMGKKTWMETLPERIREAELISSKTGLPFARERLNNNWKGA